MLAEGAEQAAVEMDWLNALPSLQEDALAELNGQYGTSDLFAVLTGAGVW